MTTSAIPTMSSPGIGSNLDVNSIVSQLMAVENQPGLLMDAKEADYQAQLSAFGSLSGALSTFQTAMQGLSSAATFQSLTATPADSTVLTASADTTAASGTYAVNVTNLAQAQSIYAAGQASSTTAIGTGATTTLTFNFGTISGGTLSSGQYSGATFTQDPSHASATVTIDSTNNSLQGISDAINAANIGVTASIVNDGSASPYRLVLTSNATGAAQSMQISVSGDAALQSLLGYDPAGTQNLTQSSAAQNASLTVNGIGITSATNQVTGAVTGVTLNLAKQNSSTTVTVANNTSAVQSAVQSFVSAYNSLSQTIDSLTAYDATTQKGAILMGDSTVLSLQGSLRSLTSSILVGASPSLNSLSALGVGFQSDGTLALDSTALQTALTNNYAGIASLFAQTGTATDSLVQYAAAGSNTQPGTYAVNLTQLATQGKATGSAAAALTITAGTNDTLALTIDGVSTNITLAAGTYTADTLATQLQSAINNASAFKSASIAATVSQSGGVLTITSNSYGSASTVSVTGGTAATDLFGATPASSTGLDVAGTIGGNAATGSGQTLTGGTGTPVEGLQVKVTGGATGARGTVSATQGFAYQLAQLATNFLDPTSGAITAATNGINQSITDVTNQRNDFNDRMAVVQQNYLSQFTALDTLISSMNSTSSFLTQQLAQIQANTAAIAKFNG